MAASTPNQRLRTSSYAKLSNGKYTSLPAGSLVKCIDKSYVPNECGFGDYNVELYVAAHSRFGMALIDKTDIDWNYY